MKLALAQIDPVVGDLDGNRALILARVREAREAGADLVVLPELAVTGYPPEDLLLRPGFVRAAQACTEAIAAEVEGIVALVGTPLFGGARGKAAFASRSATPSAARTSSSSTGTRSSSRATARSWHAHPASWRCSSSSTSTSPRRQGLPRSRTTSSRCTARSCSVSATT